jgi:hypothetical protein
VSIFLNAQTRVFCAGEVWNLADVGLPNEAEGGDLWKASVNRYEADGGDFSQLLRESKTRFALFGRTDKPERARIGRDAFAFLDAQAVITGADLIVDTSKGWRRLDMLLAARPEDVYVLHLKRDGRAIVHSYSKKYDGRYLSAMRRWIVSILSGWALRLRYRNIHWLELRYEDFCAAPEKEIARVLQFIGHGSVREILAPGSDKPYIAIAGNRMRKTGNITVSRDEKWRSDLYKPVRITFDLTLGWLNFLHGYRPWR